MVSNVTETYNKKLIDNPDISEKIFYDISKAYEKNKIMIGDKILPFFLTPDFIPEVEEELIRKSSERMSELLEKVGKHLKKTEYNKPDGLLSP